MVELFVVSGTNTCVVPVLRDSLKWRGLDSTLNFRSLTAGWEPPEFVFDDIGQANKDLPDICPSYLSGMLVLRAELALVIFPSNCSELEFLPIRVNGEDWRLLNCLKATKGYDVEASKFFRGENGQICFVQHLVVTDPAVENCELFTLEDSNRAQLYCLPSFKERVERLGLKGLGFRRIGTFEPGQGKQL